jgi:hypothetical protein
MSFARAVWFVCAGPVPKETAFLLLRMPTFAGKTVRSRIVLDDQYQNDLRETS